MNELVYFMLWAGVIFLMMRFGCGAHVMGHGRGKAKHREGAPEGQATEGLRWVPPADDVDPVCGKSVSTETAKPSVHDSHVYYFCSRDCRERFEAAPERAIPARSTTHRSKSCIIMNYEREKTTMKRERGEQKSFEDPVCGMQVSYKTAATESDYQDKRYYFCATACREQFDADPERYVRTHRQHGSRRE